MQSPTQRFALTSLVSLSLVLLSSVCTAQQINPESDYRFGAIAWMQRSAEYRVLTEQTYRYALTQLTTGIKDRKWTADEAQLAEGGYELKKPAVILDLDETVLDNSAFNARNVVHGQAFTNDIWNAWCNEAKADAIPGSLEFVQAAEGLGVTVFFLTNREDVAKPATIENLKRLGFNASESNVLTQNKNDGRPDDKLSRRAAVAKEHRIVLLIGDSMGDLCDGMDIKDFKARNTLATQKTQMLGTRWIILPNPVYGGWQRAIPKGVAALETKENTSNATGTAR
ncbi:MAG: HAD family acid phosphatase [Pirellulales bacterium]